MELPLVHDPWLSEVLGKATWRLDLTEAFVREYLNNSSVRNAFEKRQKENLFIYCKASVKQLEWITLLEKAGFHLIDTNITLAKPIQNLRKKKRSKDENGIGDDWKIRFATSNDEKETMKLAGRCFTYSRFHLDPDIPEEKANAVKTLWAGNYFRGQRGNFMIIALEKKSPIGFLQLLNRDKILIIDLIGVDAEYRCSGVGNALITYAEEHCGNFKSICVGTQVANIPSIRFYERQGFTMTDANYIFHFHGKDLKTR